MIDVEWIAKDRALRHPSILDIGKSADGVRFDIRLRRGEEVA